MICKNCNHKLMRFSVIGITGWTHKYTIKSNDTIHKCRCGCKNPEPSLIKTIKNWIDNIKFILWIIRHPFKCLEYMPPII